MADHLDAMFGRSVGLLASLVCIREDLVPLIERRLLPPTGWRYIRWPVDRTAYLRSIKASHWLGKMPVEHSVCPVLLQSRSLRPDNLQSGRVIWAMLDSADSTGLRNRLDTVAPDGWAVEVGTGQLDVFVGLNRPLKAAELAASNRDLAMALGSPHPAAVTSLVQLAGTIVYRHSGAESVRFLREPPSDRVDRYIDPRESST